MISIIARGGILLRSSVARGWRKRLPADRRQSFAVTPAIPAKDAPDAQTVSESKPTNQLESALLW